MQLKGTLLTWKPRFKGTEGIYLVEPGSYVNAKWQDMGSLLTPTISSPGKPLDSRNYLNCRSSKQYSAGIPGRLLTALSCMSATHKGMQGHEGLFTKAARFSPLQFLPRINRKTQTDLAGRGVELLSLQLSTVSRGEPRLSELLPWSKSKTAV